MLAFVFIYQSPELDTKLHEVKAMIFLHLATGDPQQMAVLNKSVLTCARGT